MAVILDVYFSHENLFGSFLEAERGKAREGSENENRGRRNIAGDALTMVK